MSLTGKTISQLDYLSAATSNTLFPVELSGSTYYVPFSGMSASVNYTIYKVLLSYSLGTFTVTQLENTIGNGSNTSPADIEWTDPATGVIRATKTGAFSSSNILIVVPSITASGSVYLCTGTKSTQNFLTINMYLHAGTQTSTPSFNNLPIEIRIY